MNLALDFDNTYTANIPFWRAFIELAQNYGATVAIVTMRSKELDYDSEFNFLKDFYKVETIFCDGEAKKKVCEEAGYDVDIWIDDYPEGVTMGTQYTLAELAKWREGGRAA